MVVSLLERSEEVMRLQSGLEFVNFIPRVKKDIFKHILWLNRLFSGNDDCGFQKDGVKAFLTAPIKSPLNLPTFFLISHL